MDQSPFGADVLNAILALTPASAAIAIGCITVLAASVVLVVLGLRLQIRGAGARPWMAMLITGLLVGGSSIAWTVDAWFRTVTLIYSDSFGQPSAPAPAALTGAWPTVLLAGQGMAALALVAILLTALVAARRRRRTG